MMATTLIVGFGAISSSAAAAPLNPQADVAHVSCSQAGDCTAVTTYNDAIGYSFPLAYTETNGSWSSPTALKLPANAYRSPEDGYGNKVTNFRPYEFFSFDLLYLGDDQSGLDVQCWSPGNCTAVGTYTTKRRGSAGVFLTEKDGHWSRGVQAQQRSDGKTEAAKVTELSGPSCTSAGNCTAVGTYRTGRQEQPIVFTDTNGKWGPGTPLKTASSSTPKQFAANSLVSVSCPAVGDCAAVGFSINQRLRTTPLLATERSGHWTIAVAQMPANAAASTAVDSQGGNSPGGLLSSVSCPAVNDCVAAGFYTDQGFQQQPMVVDQSPTGWDQGQELTLPASGAVDTGGQTAQITTIDCPDVGDCAAVGSFTDTDQNQQGLLLDETGGTWATGVAATLPAGFTDSVARQFAGFQSVSCPTAGNCVAVGHYNEQNAGHTTLSLVDDETAGSWSNATNAQLPANAAHTQHAAVEGVDCVSGSGSGPVAGADCALVGGYANSSSQWRGFSERTTGGTAQKTTGFAIPGVNSTEISDSLYQALNPSFTYPTQYFSRLREYPIGFRAAVKGRLSIDWRTTVNGHTVLIGHAVKEFSEAGRKVIRMKIGKRAHKALKGLERFTVRISASFTTASGHRYSRTSKFKVRKRREVIIKAFSRARPSVAAVERLASSRS